MALVLVSKVGDSIRIGEVEVTVSQLTYRRATLSISAPESVAITRTRAVKEGADVPSSGTEARAEASA